MNIVFIINNKNNRLTKILSRLDQYWRQANLGSAQFISTQRKKHAVKLAKQATENRCDYIIAIGGDGTLNEIVNGVLQSSVSASEYPALGLLPFGSANDFARTARISKSIEELIKLIQSNTTQWIDLGKIILQPTRETRYFINIAGVGLGPEVVRNMERSSSLLGPSFNYFKHITKGFFTYKKKEVSCTGDSWQWKGKLLQMAVANGCYYGNGICTAPDAKIIDGRFQVVIFGDLNIWDYLKNFAKLKKGVKFNLPQVNYYDAKEVLLESDDSCGIEADGEYVGLAPAVVSILPKAIRFLLPTEVK